jgi:hypothetical protein
MSEPTLMNKVNPRALARLISNAGFRKLLTDTSPKFYGKQLKGTLEKGGIQLKDDSSIKDLLEFSFLQLQKDYRHEYLYKTKLVSDLILKEYSLADSVILNEFKIAKSIADIVLVNGTNKVFEIKTELDTPIRLKSQINDYYKAFSEVYIVTHVSLAKKYLAFVDENVGIIQLNDDATLLTVKEAIPVYSKLDNEMMMKSLRRTEFLNIVIQLFGALPQTTHVKLYRECLQLLDKVDTIKLQKHFIGAIKTRLSPINTLVKNDDVPDYLKFFCYFENLTEKNYIVLPSRLSCIV